jgi:hypothetical protein
MNSRLRQLKRRVERANKANRCVVCDALLAVLSPEDEAEVRQIALAQGLTDEQLTDCAHVARVCLDCDRAYAEIVASRGAN